MSEMNLDSLFENVTDMAGAAEMLGVTRAVLQSYVTKGELKTYKRGKSLFLLKPEIEAFMETHDRVTTCHWVKRSEPSVDESGNVVEVKPVKRTRKGKKNTEAGKVIG